MTHRRDFAQAILPLLVSLVGFAQDLRSPLFINLDLLRPDSGSGIVSYQPAFAQDDSGALSFVWTVYRNGKEKILTSGIRGAQPTTEKMLSPGAGVYYQPVIVSTNSESGWAFWMRLDAGRWQVEGRQRQKGQWSPMQTLSSDMVNGLRPAALALGKRVFLAWEEDDGKHQRIGFRSWNGETWSVSSQVSGACGPSYRPALAANADDEVWAFWDSYCDGEYAIFGRKIHPSLGDVEQISSGGARSCLKPVAIYGGKAGLVVAWLTRIDVTGAGGVIDQWFTLQAASRQSGRWRTLTAEATGGDAADLRHSLLPVIEPQVTGLYGYQGRRRQPMLVEDNGAVWLLWERRIVHDGRGNTAGELCGRRLDGQRWSAPVSLHQGFLDYRVPAGGRTRDGRLIVVAKGLHLYYMAMQVDLSAGKPFRFEELWSSWKPIRLPLRPDSPRPSIEVDGRTHNLYWADLHVHSGLTPDAEGEVDELMHFARDKARLDVIVMQENDFIGRMLTEGEYRFSIYSSRRFTEPGRFVALPGFEWTHRMDDGSRNHRTVMFAGKDTPILRHPENGGNFDELCDAVEAAGGAMNTQHETFRLSRRTCDANIEVASGWRVFINNPAKIHRDLSDGHRAGFIATSDGHRRDPGTGGGLTGIYAPELTPSAILSAIRDHRVYATNGSRVVLDARANGVFMGRDVRATGGVDLRLKVSAERPIVRAVLVCDGKEIHTIPGDNRTVLDSGYTDRPGSGYHWYYWRVELEGNSPDYPANIKVAEGHLAWSSPHRVTVR